MIKSGVLEDSVNVAYCSDFNGLKYLSVSLQSLVCHASSTRRYNIYIVTDAVNSLEAANLLCFGSNNLKIELVDSAAFDQLSKDLFVDRHLTTAAYWRFFLPLVLSNLQKVVYIDIDTIVLDDISRLYDLELGDHLVGGVLDKAFSICNSGDFKLAKAELSRLGYTNYQTYINSGVLLINLSQWRSKNLTKKLLTLARENEFIFHDQDALNICCGESCLLIDERWNFSTHVSPELYGDEERKRIVDRIKTRDLGIVHYPGKFKPWCSSVGLMSGVWVDYAVKNPYFSEQDFQSGRRSILMTAKLSIKSFLPTPLWVFLRNLKATVYHNYLIRICLGWLSSAVTRISSKIFR